MAQPIIVWFRQDLRLDDNPALESALQSQNPVICVFIDDPTGQRRAGTMSLWWRDVSLTRLHESLAARGNGLVFLKGDSQTELDRLIAETGAATVYWNRQYEADSVARDTKIKTALKQRGLQGESFNAHMLFEPWEITSKSTGGPFKVFTPFWRACRAAGLNNRIWNAPSKIPAAENALKGLPLPAAAAFSEADRLADWQPGETGARRALDVFLTRNAHGYAEKRNLPAEPATSRLSPHLRWGEISPVRIVAETQKAKIAQDDSDKFLAEIGWREFAYQLLFHNPHMSDTCLAAKFEAFPWREASDDFEAWKRGETGYPIVDAGCANCAAPAICTIACG